MEANPMTPADLAAIRVFAKDSADYLRNYHKKEDDIGSELDPDDAVTLCDFFEDEVPRILATVEALRAENERLRDGLRAVRIYGSDTLSGRVDGPADAAWYRDAVREMRNRARRVLGGLTWDAPEATR